MKRKNKTNNNKVKEKLKRTHQIKFALNEKEYKVFIKYVKKYKIKNKAQFIRETLFRKILEDFDKDYPKLFDI